MSFRTNPDRILDHIDRQRNRDDDGRDNYARDATARELGTELPEPDATPGERVRRIFGLVEKAYVATASSTDIRRLAHRFQTVGDISAHHALGDVTITVSYLDHERMDDVGAQSIRDPAQPTGGGPQDPEDEPTGRERTLDPEGRASQRRRERVRQDGAPAA